MDTPLWAPWRIEYIENVDNDQDGCIFCWKPGESDDRKNLILHRSDHCFVILNLFPYNNGHMMVVPYRHVGDFTELTSEELADINEMVKLCMKAVREVMNPHGFNIGWNMGRVAGAGIEDHVHCHLVPRWNGDTNFMPVLGKTKVISEELGKTWDKLKPLFVEQMS